MLNEVNAELLGLYLLMMTYGGFFRPRVCMLLVRTLTMTCRDLLAGVLSMHSHLPTEESRRERRQ